MGKNRLLNHRNYSQSCRYNHGINISGTNRSSYVFMPIQLVREIKKLQNYSYFSRQLQEITGIDFLPKRS